MSATIHRRAIRVQAAAARRFVAVPEEFVDLYAPRIGHRAVAAWLVLRLAAERGQAIAGEQPAAFIARSLGMEVLEAAEALRQLTLYELVEPHREGGLLVREPLSRQEFERRFGTGATPGAAPGVTQAAGRAEPPPDAACAGPAEVAAAGEGPGKAPGEAAADGPGGPDGPDGLPRDVRGVLDWYHQRIGLISESQFERLCEWIIRRGMTADVVALAIEETARSAQYASFSYLEGVLRNWYNQGVRTWQDLSRRRHLSSVLSQALEPGSADRPAPVQGGAAGEGGAGRRPASGADGPMEGVPNAEAYRPVDPEQVKRWKEMYARGR